MDLGLEGALGSSSDGVRDDDDNINISDVIEVIQTTDPDFKQSGMFSGGGEISTVPGQANTAGQRVSGGGTTRRQAYVKILEQPASKALRFRYECEGRSAGSIPGASSTPENKTFPAIQVIGYQGRAVVVVSCVTKDPPYRPHPHNLVGREGCRRGVCTLEVSPETMAVTFSNLGIQCVKKKDIEDALKVREEIRVDPFRTGFAHRNQPTSIDLNAVRLCFQVFLEGDNRGKFTVPLSPVVSDPIYDKKAMSDLVICKLSDCTCTVAGGKEIILLCEKVAKEDIQVRFYEESNGAVMWEALGDFQPTHVHKQVAISFRTPRYGDHRTVPQASPCPLNCCPWTQSENKIDEVEIIEPPPAKSKPMLETNLDEVEITVVDEWQQNDLSKVTNKPKDWCDYSEVEKIAVNPKDIQNMQNIQNNNNNIEEKSLNDLLNQVAELDEIYSDTQARLLTINDQINDAIESEPVQIQPMEVEAFDDSNTYSSLQLAFKNPIEIELPNKYDDVITAHGPQEKARQLHSQLNMFNIPAETSVKIEPRDTSPSPYGGQMYGGSGFSPVYNPQGGTSSQPQYLFPVDNLAGRTPSPLDAQNYAFPPSNFPNITPPPPMNIQSPAITTSMNWNVANVTDDQAGPFNTAAEASNAMNVVDSAGAGLSSVLDLDSQELTQLDSAELAGLNLFDANLSENLSNNLSLSDIKTDTHHKEDMAQENMTDSFTRLTTATIDNICNLNNMYKPNIKE
ncbi:dorsal [Carabus blaptoides fortunei]